MRMLLKLFATFRKVCPKMAATTFFTRQRAPGYQKRDSMDVTQFVVLTRWLEHGLVADRLQGLLRVCLSRQHRERFHSNPK